MPDYGMPPLSRAEKLYRALLRLYPRKFRDEFGLDLIETFRDEQKAAMQSGLHMSLFWLETLRNLITQATIARVSTATGQAPARNRPNESLFPSVDNLLTESRIAFRALVRRPGFALTIAATLALAIGVNTAAFSVVDAVVLHPLQISEPENVVAAFKVSRTSPFDQLSYPAFIEFQSKARSLEKIAAFNSTTVPVTDANTSADYAAQFVTAEYFPIVGTRAAIGRVLNSGDNTDNERNEMVVLSHSFWINRFGGDSAIVGKHISVANKELTVVGVAARGFVGMNLATPQDMWIPISARLKLELGRSTLPGANDAGSESNMVSIIARMRAGATIEAVAAEMNAVERLRRKTIEVASAAGVGASAATPIVTVIPANDAAAAVRDRSTLIAYLRLLCSVVGITLLLACLNVANLMVVRSRERAVELGVRAALGATSTMLARYLLIEALMLALAGGFAGLAIAAVMLKLFASFALPGGIVLGNLNSALGPRVFLFTLGITIVSALAFGAYPAIAGARRTVLERFRSGETSPRPRLFGRSALLAVQIGIALTLLTGAATFVETLRMGLATNLGFDSERVAAVSIKPFFDGSREQRAELYANVTHRLEQMPGVEAAAATSFVPLQGSRALPFQRGAMQSAVIDAEVAQFPMVSVTPEYFRVLGMQIVSGRAFSSVDSDKSTRVAIINESTARQWWPVESAIGKIFTFTVDSDVRYTVVGVVRDTKYATVQDSGVMFAYSPMSQEDPRAQVHFIARTANPRSLLPALQNVVADAAPQLTTIRPRVVRDQINTVLLPQRFGATLLSCFALLALVLSAVGIHGTVSYTVARRRRELGVRMALGASGTSVVVTVLRDVGVATVCGIVIGSALAAATQQLLTHFLKNVSLPGYAPFVVATLLLSAIAMLASSLPALRATRINPMNVIRPS